MSGISQTAEQRYSQLTGGRYTYLRRAEDCARLTIPSLVPPEGSSSATEFLTPYQSIGARGVNNLASKLLLALLPPNQSFFRLTLGEFAEDQIAGSPDVKAQLEAALGKIERSVATEIETTPTRVSVFETLKQLITAGNVLVYLQPEDGIKVFTLRNYVVKRSPSGTVLDIVVKECISESELTPDARAIVGPNTASGQGKGVEDVYDLYTWIKRHDGKYMAFQEIKGKRIPGTGGAYPADKSPWMALRWTKLDGEDYGRGHVEEYYGDLRSLEGLSQAILEGSAAAAKVIILVNPSGTTSERTISEADNLAVRSGNAADVTVVQLQKHADFTVAANQIDRLERRLSQAFLLVGSVQRQAERVTAEEIRLLAGELEDSLGGIYALLAQEFQLPYVTRLIFQMAAAKKIPPLPQAVTPSIVTGMEALGRGHDLQRLTMFSNMVNSVLGPAGFSQIIKPNAYVLKLATALGLSLDGLVKTDDEIAQAQQAENQNQLMQKVGPEAIRQAGNNPPAQQGA